MRAIFCALQGAFFVFGLCLTSMASAASAFEHACVSKLLILPPAHITVTPVVMTPGTRQVSSAQLSREAASVSTAAASRLGPVVVGLTGTTWQYRVSVEHVSLSDPSEGICFKPMIHVEMALTPLVVSVGSEFKPTSCAFNFIRAHEMEHVRMYQAFLPDAAQQLEDSINQRYAGLVKVKGPAEMQEALKQARKEVQDKIQELIRKNKARHAQFDRDDAQHLANLSCLADIKKVVNQTSQAL